MRLFDERERLDPRPARYAESNFAFLNRVRSPWWERVRTELEAWFAEYPQDNKADLCGRFRSPAREQHWPAWWELYLFRLFTRLGYDVSVHPQLADSRARPDFLVSSDGSGFYVEALTVFSGIIEEGRDEMREAWIIDIVNEVRSQTFSVGIDFEQVGKKRPKKDRITRPIERWLASLDPDAVESVLRNHHDPPSLRLMVDDWQIVLEAFPISPEYRHEPPGRLVGSGPVSGGPVDDVDRIRAALRRKCASYPRVGRPLVLAALSMSTFGDTASFEQALFGTHAVRYIEGDPGSGRWVRLRDGAWMSGRGATGKHVSAALTASHLAPWQITNTLPRLWRNPWAEEPLQDDLPFPSGLASPDGAVALVDGTTTASALFALPPDWPGTEPWET